MNNIREAIKPRPLPDYSKLYNPPDPDSSPYEASPQGDVAQIVEVATQEEPNTKMNVDKDEDGDQLVQGADGGFLRRPKGRRPKQKLLKEESASSDSVENGDDTYKTYGTADGERSADEARDDSSPDSIERLSRAARRKRIKEEIAKINGPDPKPGANPYRRRRMW